MNMLTAGCGCCFDRQPGSDRAGVKGGCNIYHCNSNMYYYRISISVISHQHGMPNSFLFSAGDRQSLFSSGTKTCTKHRAGGL
jgi:hypothetical protein